MSSKESSSSPSKQKAIKGSRQSPRKKPSSPSDSPSRQFSSDELSSPTKPSPSPRQARALRRQELESDALPEDDQTRDSGTSSLDSPKKPFSSRQLTEHNDRTKSAKQVNGLGGAEDSNACQSKKAKMSESLPQKRKEPPLVIKRKRSKPR